MTTLTPERDPCDCGDATDECECGGKVTDLTDWVSAYNEEALLADGFEDAFLGMCEVFNRPTLATYDRDKCIEILVQRDEMAYEEAVEYFEFNVVGAWVGDNTPIYLTLRGGNG